MQTLFLSILKMSITASYIFLFVIAVRFLMKKVPKELSYILWAVVFIRLICPFSFESSFSIFNLFKTGSAVNSIPVNISNTIQPQAASTGVSSIQHQALKALPAATHAASVDPIQIIIFIASIIWALGVLLLIIYSVISYISLKRKVKTALLIKNNIFECENIDTPFVLGVIKPKIYLPVYLLESEKSYILKHEQIHIKRFDYIIKPIAFLALCIHWFNPIVWISFILMNKDMEMSCDEAVIKTMGTEIKKDYSSSLLSLAVNRKMINGCPITFGESNAKSRIKNILNYKHPALWVVKLATLIIVAISVVLISNPIREVKTLDTAFLNINYTISQAKDHESLILRIHGKNGTIISGAKFSNWLSKGFKQWKENKTLSLNKIAPSITIYISNSRKYQLRFYKSYPDSVMLLYKDKYTFYKVPKDTYKEVESMYFIQSNLIPEVVLRAIIDGRETDKQNFNGIPNVKNYKGMKIGSLCYYLYEQFGRYYCESPYMFINEIPKNVYEETIKYADTNRIYEKVKNSKIGSETTSLVLVENNLKAIMSSPKESSNPEDYIKAHQNEYKNIIKGGDVTLNYMLSQLKQGKNIDGLRGQIMMRLCKEILGVRNNVADETLSPKDWANKLHIH